MSQEVQLLPSAKMMQFYRTACVHAVQLKAYFDNKSNLHRSDKMRRHIEWFVGQLMTIRRRVSILATERGGPEKRFSRGRSLNVLTQHFERQFECMITSTEDIMDLQDVLRILKVPERVPWESRTMAGQYALFFFFFNQGPSLGAVGYPPTALVTGQTLNFWQNI